MTQPSHYFVDLGFDWNSIPKANGTCELEVGYTNITNPTAGVPVTELKSLNTGDTIFFNIYDVTQLDSGVAAAGNPTPQLVNPWLTSVVDDTNTLAGSAGFSNMSDVSTAVVGPQTANGNSPALNPTGPASPLWPILMADGKTPLQLVVQNPNTNGMPASYRLTFTIQVVAGTDFKIFSLDPEMVVSGSGGGGG